MTFSSIVAIIGGIVTVGCAVAGAIAGIRARRAREAREEELRRAEHEARLARMREARQSRVQPTQIIQQVPVPQPMMSQPQIHYYIPQQTQTYSMNNQNQYMNRGYTNIGYSYGNSYKDPIYAGERAIGNMSKMEMMRQRFYPNMMQPQYNYYPTPQYAYAV